MNPKTQHNGLIIDEIVLHGNGKTELGLEFNIFPSDTHEESGFKEKIIICVSEINIIVSVIVKSDITASQCESAIKEIGGSTDRGLHKHPAVITLGEDGLLPADKRKVLVQSVLQRLGQVAQTKSKQQTFQQVIHCQARSIKDYLQDKCCYRPFLARW